MSSVPSCDNHLLPFCVKHMTGTTIQAALGQSGERRQGNHGICRLNSLVAPFMESKHNEPVPYTYAGAGVSIDAGNALVRAIAPLARAKIGRAQSELQSLMRNSYAVFCLKKKKITKHKPNER